MIHLVSKIYHYGKGIYHKIENPFNRVYLFSTHQMCFPNRPDRSNERDIPVSGKIL